MTRHHFAVIAGLLLIAGTGFFIARDQPIEAVMWAALTGWAGLAALMPEGGEA